MLEPESFWREKKIWGWGPGEDKLRVEKILCALELHPALERAASTDVWSIHGHSYSIAANPRHLLLAPPHTESVSLLFFHTANFLSLPLLPAPYPGKGRYPRGAGERIGEEA